MEFQCDVFDLLVNNNLWSADFRLLDFPNFYFNNNFAHIGIENSIKNRDFDFYLDNEYCYFTDNQSVNFSQKYKNNRYDIDLQKINHINLNVNNFIKYHFLIDDSIVFYSNTSDRIQSNDCKLILFFY